MCRPAGKRESKIIFTGDEEAVWRTRCLSQIEDSGFENLLGAGRFADVGQGYANIITFGVEISFLAPDMGV